MHGAAQDLPRTIEMEKLSTMNVGVEEFHMVERLLPWIPQWMQQTSRSLPLRSATT